MSTHLLPLRDYQQECIDAFERRVAAGDTRIPSVLATGLGKTVIFSHQAERFLRNNKGKRVLIIAHTNELIEQAAKKVRQVAPHCSVGIVKAERNQCTAQVIVSSRQTLASESRRNQIRNVGFIIVDEAHHATRENTYGTILEHYGAFEYQKNPIGTYIKTEPSVIVAGFTATLIRGDKAKLSAVWQPGKTFRKDINFGIRHGYLLDVKGHRVQVPTLDLSQVKKTGGDYQDGALADELERSLAPELVAAAYVEHASDRLGIGFAPTVESAETFAAAFREAGISSETIHGKLPKFEREMMLKRLDTGETRVLWGCMVLTEGFDNPRVSCVVWARPTKLPGLYQQGIGRALRPELELPPAQRGHALVLDVVGVSRDHTLASLIDLSLPEDPYDTEEEEQFPCAVCELLPCECPPEEKEEAFPDAAQAAYLGPVEVVDFDPLARDSDHAWARTTGGTYVLTAGTDAFVFLVPESTPGEYGIAFVTKDRSTYAFLECGDEPYFKAGHRCNCPVLDYTMPAPHKGVLGGWSNGHRNLPMDMALAWGVDVAEELGGHAAQMFGTKNKRWRKSKEISDAQKFMLTSNGVEITDTMTKGEASDIITAIKASKRIDPVVGALRAQMEKDMVNA